jgi:HKD family nuclease
MTGFRYLATYMALVTITCVHAQSVQPIVLSTPSVIFTDPLRFEQGEKDNNLLKQISNLIKATPAGEEITVCVFKFELEALAHQLVAAQDRGVKIRIILNKGDTSKDANKQIKDFLRTKLHDFHYIENKITDKGIIHNKFILFSEVETTTGPLHDLILQTSSNFQMKGAKKLQDMLLISSPQLYHCFLDFWFQIKVLGNTNNLEDYNYFSCSDLQQRRAFFFPKRRDKEEFGSDNVLKVLKDIEEPESTLIHFAHGKWDENRESLAQELEELKRQGAQVEVVTNFDVDNDIREELEKLDDGVFYLDDDYNMHTKFFLVAEGEKKEVWTGSHNLTDRSLRENFEVLLKIEDKKVYQAYLDYFNSIKQLAAH